MSPNGQLVRKRLLPTDPRDLDSGERASEAVPREREALELEGPMGPSLEDDLARVLPETGRTAR